MAWRSGVASRRTRASAQVARAAAHASAMAPSSTNRERARQPRVRKRRVRCAHGATAGLHVRRRASERRAALTWRPQAARASYDTNCPSQARPAACAQRARAASLGGPSRSEQAVRHGCSDGRGGPQGPVAAGSGREYAAACCGAPHLARAAAVRNGTLRGAARRFAALSDASLGVSALLRGCARAGAVASPAARRIRPGVRHARRRAVAHRVSSRARRRSRVPSAVVRWRVHGLRLRWRRALLRRRALLARAVGGVLARTPPVRA